MIDNDITTYERQVIELVSELEGLHKIKKFNRENIVLVIRSHIQRVAPYMHSDLAFVAHKSLNSNGCDLDSINDIFNDIWYEGCFGRDPAQSA